MSGSNPPNAVVLLDDTSDAFYNPQAWSTRKNEYHYNGGQWVNDGAAESSISCAFEGALCCVSLDLRLVDADSGL